MSMHADEESDEGVVPMKRSNNEGVSSAETVEGRTSPKGNGGQTAAARTLRRDTASNGLAAVRQAARQSKTVRFTALLHHITTDLLKRSYLALARDAAPGIDGVTLALTDSHGNPVASPYRKSSSYCQLPLTIAALILAALISTTLISDGESTWFEGVQLLGVYALLGVLFYYA